MLYDFLIVGAGLYGSVFAYEITKMGKQCLVIDKRGHVGGNVYTEETEGIQVHKYGAHIFHTSNKIIWDYINHFAEFNRFTNAPLAVYKDEIYNLPFNMNTFSRMWNIKTPDEAEAIVKKQIKESHILVPKNLEEQAIKLVGYDIYEKLVKGYTEKQWGMKATELPPFIIKRLPVRFTYDNNYFSDKYQGIPIGGYTNIVTKMLKEAHVELNTDFFQNKEYYTRQAKRILFTGRIDEYFDYEFGELEYRSLLFEHKLLDMKNYQGNAVVNYTDASVPYTRIIEHKHFEFGQQDKTLITYEYPVKMTDHSTPYYPVNNERNDALYLKYKQLGEKETTIFGGRLAEFRYYDMHDVISAAINQAERVLTEDV